MAPGPGECSRQLLPLLTLDCHPHPKGRQQLQLQQAPARRAGRRCGRRSPRSRRACPSPRRHSCCLSVLTPGSLCLLARAGANQDWVDVHPAKLGWHSTGHSYGAPIWGPNASIAFEFL